MLVLPVKSPCKHTPACLAYFRPIHLAFDGSWAYVYLRTLARRYLRPLEKLSPATFPLKNVRGKRGAEQGQEIRGKESAEGGG